MNPGALSVSLPRSKIRSAALAKPHHQRIIDEAASKIDFLKGIITREEWCRNTSHDTILLEILLETATVWSAERSHCYQVRNQASAQQSR